jgi:hypothetical protein
LTPRRSQPPRTPPSLSPEKAHLVLSKQLELLRDLKALGHHEGIPKEQEWANFTGNIVLRAFGSDSPNINQFVGAGSAGEYFVIPFGASEDPNHTERNYQARLQAYEGVLNGCLSELSLDLPEPEIKGVFEPGQEYELYVAVKTILGFANQEIFVVDPYLSSELFDLYAGAIPRSVSFRLLSNNIPTGVLQLAYKYAAGGNLKVRTTNAIHDRVLFADSRVWLCGQSLKDAARKKPTYIVEHDEPLMRTVYENIWGNSITVMS